MSDSELPASVLAADIGSTLTHVALFARVEGVYRFVARAEAPTTLREPECDVTLGLRRAIKRLEEIAGRRLLNDQEEPLTPEAEPNAGVDAFVATSNAAPALQCVIVGLTDDLSVESAKNACAAANVWVAQTISLGKRMRQWDDRSLEQMRRTPPDIILLVGGMDTGPVAPLQGAARVLTTIFEGLAREKRPVIVFAGNQEARRPVAQLMSPDFEVRVVDNVRPNVHLESLGELQRELAEIYERIKLASLPGYRRLRRWCQVPILSSMEALSIVWRFMARRHEPPQSVLGVDVGGATTYVGAARGELYQWVVGANLGTSFGCARVSELSPLGHVLRWLPVAMPADEAVHRLENIHLRPHSIPQTMEDLLLVQAIARQALLLTMRRMRHQFWSRPEIKPEEETNLPFDLIAARGGALVHTPQDGVIALTLLDALQPVGLAWLVLDWASIWPQLGALALVAPLAAGQVLERDGLRPLGTVLAPRGDAREGERALRIKIVYPDGHTVEDDIPAGVVQRFPLPPDAVAQIEVWPSRDWDIGLGRQGQGGKAEVRGGDLGIIVDTRGRPLALPQDAEYRRRKLQQWLGDLLDHGHRPV
jgi:hypothetical protein